MKTKLFILFGALVPLMTSAQIGYNGGVYSQDFNTLQNAQIFTPYTTLPTGWVVSQGSYVLSTVSGGYSPNYGTYCFATAAGGTADRSLGVVPGSTGPAAFGAQFRNLSGTTLTSFTLSYYEEQWAIGAVSGVDQVNPFHYSVGAGSLTSGTYTDFAALSMHSIHDGTGAPLTMLYGDEATNRVLITATVSGITWAPNIDLWIRWDGGPFSLNASHAMAVDDLSFVANIPEPGSSLPALCALAGLVFIRIRARLPAIKTR